MLNAHFAITKEQFIGKMGRKYDGHLARHWIAGKEVQVWHVQVDRFNLWDPVHPSKHTIRLLPLMSCARSGLADQDMC